MSRTGFHPSPECVRQVGAMITLPKLQSVLCTLALLATACNKGEDGPSDGTKDTKAEKGAADGAEKAGDEGEPSLKVATGEDEVEGPVPPETSMVFFVVEGALLPLACFVKDDGKLQAGVDCLDLMKAGEKARVTSGDTATTMEVGERVEPQCQVGSGKTIALAAEGLADGPNYKYGTWPPSGLKTVTLVSEETIAPHQTQLDDEQKTKLLAAIKKDWAGASGEVEAHQVAEIDLDGKDEKDRIFAAYIPHPRMSEQYAWSGIFLAPGGDLDALVLLDKSNSKRDVFEVRGTLDLDGDGTQELWMRMFFDEGGGDRIVKLEDGKPRPLGDWSCGAG